MPQQVRFRRQRVVNYEENSRRSEELSRGMIYRELALRLQGSVNVGSDFVTDGRRQSLRPGEEWGVVRRIDIIANGSDVLRSISGDELRWLNLFWYGNPPRTTFAFANAAPSAVVAFDSTLVLPFWTPRSLRPIDTALDARLLSDLRIEITWGDVNSILSENLTAHSIVAEPNVTVYSLESFGVEGPFAQSRIFRLEETNLLAQDEFRMELPVSAMYRGFLIHLQDDTGNDLLNGLDNIKIRSGTTVFFDVAGNVWQDWSMSRSGLQERAIDPDTFATTPAIPARQLPYFISSNSDIEAWYWIDLATDGRMTEAIDTLGFSELILEFDVNTSIGQLTVLPQQIIPVRAARNG